MFLLFFEIFLKIHIILMPFRKLRANSTLELYTRVTLFIKNIRNLV